MKVVVRRAPPAVDALHGTSGPVETVEIPMTPLGLIAGIVGILPALVTALTDVVVKPLTQRDTTVVETAKLGLDSRKASAELYRVALAIEDEGKRHKAVQFLVKAKLVDPNSVVEGLAPADVPHVPTSSP